jgi:trehalose 6-phosphate synthase/phosphatase
MSRLLIVSNRLPITIEKRKGNLRFRRSAGGLATGLGSFYKSYKGMWIGWCGIPSDEVDMEEKKDIVTELTADLKSYPVFLSRRDVETFYAGFCNRTIWPLFHCFTQYSLYDKSLWEAYRRVNEAFCDRVVELAKNDDIIWVHDYQLMLLPRLIRERLPQAQIGFFLHIPFPPFEIFHLLPWRKEILKGLLEADVVGFHTYDYVRNFLESVHRLLGHEHAFGQVTSGDRLVNVDTFPMGIDYGRFQNAVHDKQTQKDVEKLRKRTGGRRIILSVDRLDYTKGIIKRLEAFDYFLEKNPKYREKVSLIHVAVPSRTRVEQYRILKKQVDELIGQINGKHGTIGWMPVWYLYRYVPFNSLVALYNIADVALVTPLKDGMNLIAKEFVASKTNGHGILILSEMAGAAKELGEAIIVNPNNKEEIAEALKEALSMPEEEQRKRNTMMQERLQRYDVQRWANDFMESLSQTKKLQQQLYAKKLTPEAKKKLVGDSRKSKKRLIFLDYDGTLAPFAGKPEEARPDTELPHLLEALARDPRNEVVIISGRNKESLENWFENLNIGLVAEHGAWLKEKGKDWINAEPLIGDWKSEIRPILELYTDRTPASFIEEKDFSLVWHYRKVDPQLASARAMELKDALWHLTANLNLGVLEGNKVIEIKNVGINKGQVALKWIRERKWDFILAIGDDWTDEDAFAVLPESAYSIKVGSFPSRARFNVDSIKDVRSLLKQLAV